MKKILLIITGSVAAVKTFDLLSRLQDVANVTCVLSRSGAKFIDCEALERLSGNKVYRELFDIDDEMAHIKLSRQNDVIVLAPATADILAKMTHGFADSLASAILLARDKTVMVAPAMNVKMWENAATKRNIAQLKKDGVIFIEPESGELACGEVGFGRMAEPEKIALEVKKFLSGAVAKKLSGKKILITSGPTIEAIDPVRYITNRSSGKQGHAIAGILAKFGADVTLVAGPTSRPNPYGVRVIGVETAKEMMEACKKSLPVDVAICAAAVSDWAVAQIAEQKIKKSDKQEDFTLTFAENPDILRELAKKGKNRPELVIGFAAETELLIENAQVKLEQKGCDWIVANDVSSGKVFESDLNKVFIIDKNNVDEWEKATKKEVAMKLADKIVKFFGG